jgi:hypothetical protein
MRAALFNYFSRKGREVNATQSSAKFFLMLLKKRPVALSIAKPGNFFASPDVAH